VLNQQQTDGQISLSLNSFIFCTECKKCTKIASVRKCASVLIGFELKSQFACQATYVASPVLSVRAAEFAFCLSVCAGCSRWRYVCLCMDLVVMATRNSLINNQGSCCRSCVLPCGAVAQVPSATEMLVGCWRRAGFAELKPTKLGLRSRLTDWIFSGVLPQLFTKSATSHRTRSFITALTTAPPPHLSQSSLFL